MFKIIQSAILLAVFLIVSYSFFSFGIVQAISNGLISLLSNNNLVEVLYDTNMNSQFIHASKVTQPPFSDPKTKNAVPFQPTESTYCNVNLVGKTTFRGYSIIAGTNNVDRLNGTPNKDLILGLDGNDVINGLGEGDIICGGKGNDSIIGDQEDSEPGKDLIYGQDGDDSISGEEYLSIGSNIVGEGEDDTLVGGPGKDFLRGGGGNDYIVGGDENDVIYGDKGNDVIYGSNGNDSLYGGEMGDDKLYGGNGNDDLFDSGKSILNGGPQYDTCTYVYATFSPYDAEFLSCEEPQAFNVG